jgi:RNA polymerase sigma-70 factor (TIGR02957 family)
MTGPLPASGGSAGTNGSQVFEAHRDLMFAVAYRMLGSVADAEDAVQDAWLRWSAEPRPDVASPRAYLVRIVANTALNRLRSARTRREAYIGSWLPEPLLTAAGPDAEERAELAESVSVAMLVVLESLTPDERAVFVLREVFGFSHAEIGTALGRSAPAVRQLAHRAREHVQARRPRFDVDWDQQRAVTERFLAAAAGGDIGGLMTVLAPDVTLLSDGGGKARAARRPITGADKVARFLAGIVRRPYMGMDVADMTATVAEINATPGVLVSAGGRPIVALTLVSSGGRITALQLIANPDKLASLAAGRTLPL